MNKLLLFFCLFHLFTTEDPIEAKRLEDSEKFNKDLEQLWEDFDSEFFYTFEIPPSKRFSFFQDIVKYPSKIKGVYLVDDTTGNEQSLKMSIVDSNWATFYNSLKHQDVFNIEVPRIGRYRLIYENLSSASTIKVSFLMSSGQNKLLNATELETTHEKIRSLDGYMKTVLTQQEFMHHRFRERVKKHNKNTQYFFLYSVVETVVLISVTIFQFYYMNKLIAAKQNIF